MKGQAKKTTTYLSGSQTEPNFLFLGVNLKYSILDLISPEQIITFQVFDPIICGNKLSNASFTDVFEILFGVVPGLGRPHLKKTCNDEIGEQLVGKL